MTFEQALETFRSAFSGHLISEDLHRGEVTFFLPKSEIPAACRHLRDLAGFNFITDCLGTDRFTDEDRFEVIYHLRNLTQAWFIRLVTRVDESDLTCPTVSDIWPAANWMEREVFDMYGVSFTGHPDLRRMYMPQDFEYYPLRKEFPLIGIEGSIPLPAGGH